MRIASGPKTTGGIARSRYNRAITIDRCDCCLVVAVAALLAFGRLPTGVRDVVWGEDGRVFLGNRLRNGALRGTFDVYEGYLHVIPRILTDVAVWIFPLERFAVASMALSCAVVGLVAGLVYLCSRDLMPRRGFQILLALVTVLTPTLSAEVLGNFANLHWTLLWLAPWLFLAVPRTWLGAVVLSVVGLASGLSEIQMLLFAPLALVNARNRRSLLVAVATTAGIFVQVVCTMTNPRTPNVDMKPGLLDTLVGYAELSVLGSFDADSSRVGEALAAGGWPATLMVVVAAVGILAFALLPAYRGRGVTRIVPIALVGGSFVAWAAAIWLNPRPWWQYADFDSAQLQQLTATCYVVVPSMLLIGAVVFAAAHLFDATLRSRFAAGVAVGVIGLAFVGSFYVADVERSDGPSWSQSVRQGRETCHDGRETVEIRTMPVDWSVIVPCSFLGAESPTTTRP